MALYPEAPVPQFPYSITEVWNTIISRFDSGTEQRRQKLNYAKYDVVLTYDALSSTDFDILWNFYTARRGAYEAFYMYLPDPTPQTRTGLLVGVGDGASTIFDLPGKNTSGHTIYESGIAVPISEYTILVGGGAVNADRVQFDTPPVANAVITCDFTGIMRNRCRFEEDKLTRNMFAYLLYQTGIKLKGLNFVV